MHDGHSTQTVQQYNGRPRLLRSKQGLNSCHFNWFVLKSLDASVLAPIVMPGLFDPAVFVAAAAVPIPSPSVCISKSECALHPFKGTDNGSSRSVEAFVELATCELM